MPENDQTLPEQAGAFGTWLAEKLQPMVEAGAAGSSSDITWGHGGRKWKLTLQADPGLPTGPATPIKLDE